MGRLLCAGLHSGPWNARGNETETLLVELTFWWETHTCTSAAR